MNLITQINKTLYRFWSYVDKSQDCWEWKEARLNGYGAFYLDEETIMAHRFSWSLANGPIEPGLLVCHKCDNPPCVRPDHLFLGTHKKNMEDMVSKGRRNHVVGEQNPRAKLTKDDVYKIRELHKTGKYNYLELGSLFNTDNTNIYCIVNRKTWRHLKEIESLDSVGMVVTDSENIA
jgi:hypothetical protein